MYTLGVRSRLKVVTFSRSLIKICDTRILDTRRYDIDGFEKIRRQVEQSLGKVERTAAESADRGSS